jgi:hypothetical protein
MRFLTSSGDIAWELHEVINPERTYTELESFKEIKVWR